MEEKSCANQIITKEKAEERSCTNQIITGMQATKNFVMDSFTYGLSFFSSKNQNIFLNLEQKELNNENENNDTAIEIENSKI